MNLARDLRGNFETQLLVREPFPLSMPFDLDGIATRSLNFRRSGNRTKDLIASGRLLRRHARNTGLDAVLAIWSDMACITAWSLPRGVIKIGCEHIAYQDTDGFWGRARRASYGKLDAVVSLTKRDQPLYEKLNRKVVTIPNAVANVKILPDANREKVLLTVGHIVYRKGIDRLLWALKRPLLENPDWKFVVVGGGEMSDVDWGYMNHLSVLIQALGLKDQVEFHPATRNIFDWYSRASIYVMGSRTEGLPMVLLEAKSYGLPVVAFDCPTGPREIVRDGQDGFLIGNDTDAFSDAVSRLIKEPGLGKRFAKAAREDSQTRFSVSSVTEQWTSLLHGLRSAN